MTSVNGCKVYVKHRWRRQRNKGQGETRWEKAITWDGHGTLHLVVTLTDGADVFSAHAYYAEPGEDDWFIYPSYPVKSVRAFTHVSFFSLDAAKAWCSRLSPGEKLEGEIPESLWDWTKWPN